MTKDQSGFSLIEMLVALLLLSIGLLAVAGMQIQGLKSNHSAMLRTKATQSCEEILDRMRANRDAAIDGDYNIDLETVPTAPTYSNMPLTDLDEWKDSLSETLPSGDGRVTISSQTATVIVQWQDSFGTEAVVVEAQL